ncbi:MAG: Gfo/Idh/MocA family oxidoreductase, partial [Phycisphaerae bacterium]|nr:Gfo/Idh/MocA family oxidoreductase [Phycisphaerae bacterium]
METLGYGVIGCGTVSARHMDAAEQIQGAQLVAIADQNVEKAEQISRERESKPAVYQDYQDLLQDKNIDVVVICVPTQMHGEMTVAAARGGRHVYCEKAMAPTLKECRAMIAAADDSAVKLMIGQSTRFQVPYAQARRVIESGQVGDVIAVDGAFPTKATLSEDVGADFWRFKAGAQGHGHVVNFGCHYIDTARYISSQDPRHVSAYIGNRFSAGQIPEDQFVI